jgi:hypothetical protein
MGVLHGWHIVGGWRRQRLESHPELEEFRQQLRDLYVPPSDTGFWQAGIREADDPYRSAVEAAMEGTRRASPSFFSMGTTRAVSGRSAALGYGHTRRTAAGSAR